MVNQNDLFLAVVKGVVCKVAFGNNYIQQPLKGPSWEVMVDETQELLGGSLCDSFPLGNFFDRFSGWNDKLERGFANLDAYIKMSLVIHVESKSQLVNESQKVKSTEKSKMVITVSWRQKYISLYSLNTLSL